MRRLFVPALLLLVFVLAPRLPGLRTPARFVAADKIVAVTDGPLDELLGLIEKDEALPPLVKPSLKKGEQWTVHLRLANTAVTDKSAKDIARRIEQANAADVDFIVLEMNTPGGSVSAGQELARQIEMSPAPVICVTDGQASSMGFYLLQSCDYRMMTKRSLLMVHEPSLSGDFGGQQKDWKNMYGDLHALSEAMLYHEAHRLKISRAELAQHIANGQSWFMNIDEAIKIGAVDGVTDSVEAVLRSYRHNGQPPR
jgi:ATP-dependent protease ClpP protease subunit